MRAYLTFGEPPSGIYSGQVIDACIHLSKLSGKNVRLITFISIRNFSKTRKQIKQQYPESSVLPMFPKLKNWRLNIVALYFVCLRYGIQGIICRNAIACRLALMIKKTKDITKVVYDGRAVEYEQMKEYNIITDEKLRNDILESEKIVVNNSNFQMAVTTSLVDYWKEKFQYKKDSYIVIPCTLNSSYQDNFNPSITRVSLGFSEQDILLAYAGSISGWQSFDLLFGFLEKHFVDNPLIKVLLLTKPLEKISDIQKKYPGRIVQVWSSEKDVNSYLSLCDYGLLLREDSITNKVASPVKFAEYLTAGLNIILSDNMPDFKNFINEHHCGLIVGENILSLKKIASQERLTNAGIAKEYLTKDSAHISAKYLTVLKQC